MTRVLNNAEGFQIVMKPELIRAKDCLLGNVEDKYITDQMRELSVAKKARKMLEAMTIVIDQAGGYTNFEKLANSSVLDLVLMASSNSLELVLKQNSD